MTTKLGTPRGVDSLATNKSSASDVITLKSNDFKNLLTYVKPTNDPSLYKHVIFIKTYNSSSAEVLATKFRQWNF